MTMVRSRLCNLRAYMSGCGSGLGNKRRREAGPEVGDARQVSHFSRKRVSKTENRSRDVSVWRGERAPSSCSH